MHEKTAMEKAYGIEPGESFIITAYVVLDHNVIWQTINHHFKEKDDSQMLIETLEQALKFRSKICTNLIVFRGEWFEKPIDIKMVPKDIEDLLNLILLNKKWTNLRKNDPRLLSTTI